MVDLFISYARANRDLVCRLAEAIGALGYVVWWDEELPAHLSYGEVITEKIGEAKATLVVWSAASAASEWVRAEADMARNQKKLIQAAIDDAPPPLPFNQIQFAAIGDWSGEEDHPGWRKIRASLAALCGPAPAAGAPAAPALAAPWPTAAVPEAPRWPARRSANRIAMVAIAASLLTILTVGGLALLKGPPAAQAQPALAAPPPAPAPAAAPPKTSVVDAAVQPGDDAEAQPPAPAADDAGDED